MWELFIGFYNKRIWNLMVRQEMENEAKRRAKHLATDL